MSEKDRANFLAILDSCEKIKKFCKGILTADEFYEDEKTFDAVMMNFVVIGEAVSRLSETTKLSNPAIPWIKIKGLRNIVAHEYFGIDAEEIWQIISNDLPSLIVNIQKILED
ncbi:MAG: DUF86 domain-containing protein [Bacteroidota bacterium]